MCFHYAFSLIAFTYTCHKPSVLWRCWLGSRKGIRPVKTEWWVAGVVICLEWGADLHMAQLMPLPLAVSCFSKIQIGFTFLVLAHPGSPGKRAVKRVCVCVIHVTSKWEVLAYCPYDSVCVGDWLCWWWWTCAFHEAAVLCLQGSLCRPARCILVKGTASAKLFLCLCLLSYGLLEALCLQPVRFVHACMHAWHSPPACRWLSYLSLPW